MIPFISSLIPAPTPKVVRREESSSASPSTPAPSPWISVIDDGTPTTVTPVVSTNSAGQTTTIGAEPTGTPGSTTNNSGSGNNKDVIAKCDSTKYELAATGNTQPFIPFCAPHNGTKWWYSGNYYLTWNPSYYLRNSTVKIVLNYVDAGGAGKVARSVCILRGKRPRKVHINNHL
jgi:hypothetical protein